MSKTDIANENVRPTETGENTSALNTLRLELEPELMNPEDLMAPKVRTWVRGQEAIILLRRTFGETSPSLSDRSLQC